MFDLPANRLGFGTPALMGVESRAERLALLEAALAAGITHFDTSPYYGYGVVEPLVGEFLSAHGARVTVTTKFGIQPPPAFVRGSLVMRLARRVAALSPGLKRLLSRGASGLVSHGAFDPATAEKSLSASLRNLRRGRVEVFLLHEPAVSDTARPGLREFLVKAQQDGVIGAFGTGAAGARAEEIASIAPDFAQVLQFDSDPEGKRLDRCRAPGRSLITYGNIGPAVKSVRRALAIPSIAAEFAPRLGFDPADEVSLGAVLLAAAVEQNAEGMVLFATRDPARLRANVALVTGGSITDATRTAVRELLAAAPSE